MSTPLSLRSSEVPAPAGAIRSTPRRPRWSWAALLAGLLATAAQAQPQLVKDINTAPPTSLDLPLTNLTDVGGRLYFSAFNLTTGRELYTSDGTPDGTRLVADLTPGRGSSSPGNLTNVNGTLFFTADNGTTGVELYTSDGTPDGTRLVADLTPGPGSFSPGRLTSAAGLLFFTAPDASTPGRRDLWRSDGTLGGTRPLRCLCPEPGSFNPSELTMVGNTLFFVSDTGVNDRQLWKSDGTEAGTVRVKDINAGAADPAADVLQYLTNVNGTLYFAAYDPIHKYQLWKSDGTEAGTVLVAYFPTITDRGFSPFNLANVDGVLFFITVTGHPSAYQSQLWTSDGTAAGTRKILSPNAIRLGYTDLIGAGGVLFFTESQRPSTASAIRRRLWKSDGTPEGTGPVFFPSRLPARAGN